MKPWFVLRDWEVGAEDEVPFFSLIFVIFPLSLTVRDFKISQNSARICVVVVK